MSGVRKTVYPSVFGWAARKENRAICFWLQAVIAAVLFFVANASAHAQQQYFTFKSMLSTGGVNWCIDIAQSKYEPGAPVAIASCTGGPNQTFGYDSATGTVAAGGLCLDSQGQAADQPPSEGDRTVLAE